MPERAPVVIAGAGPTGLMCALALASQGIPVVVCEAEASLAHDLRAGTYHPPTQDMMAKYGLKAMVTLNGEKILDDVVRAFHDACHRHNRPVQPGQDMVWGAGIYLAGSQDEAIRRCEAAHDERFKWFAPFGFVRYADEQGRTWGTPGAPASDETRGL